MGDFDIFRRLVKQDYSVELVAKLLGIDGHVVDAQHNPSRGIITFTVANPYNDKVPEAGNPPFDNNS